ncbi:MBL fold metallo-hydrolase [Arthrobacter sp. SD76]|uniref:MBL fold metallo-hydrolase n=1 Tax=Arthrobacter sp. SD76 TaxID=3415007 RepID=UPI003C76EC9A
MKARCPGGKWKGNEAHQPNPGNRSRGCPHNLGIGSIRVQPLLCPVRIGPGAGRYRLGRQRGASTHGCPANARSRGEPRAILLTHLHPDHSGAAGTLARLWQVPVYVHPAELPMAQGRYRADFSMPLDRWVVMPVMRSLPAPLRRRIEAAGDISDVVQPLGPGREVPGLPGWNAVPTPGHTPGHVAFWRPSDRVLLSGDAVVTVNLNSLPGILLARPDLAGPPWYTTWDWKVAMESVDRLANLGPRLLAPGHGRPLALDVVSRLHALAGQEAKQRTRPSQVRGGLRAT